MLRASLPPLILGPACLAGCSSRLETTLPGPVREPVTIIAIQAQSPAFAGAEVPVKVKVSEGCSSPPGDLSLQVSPLPAASGVVLRAFRTYPAGTYPPTCAPMMQESELEATVRPPVAGTFRIQNETGVVSVELQVEAAP